MLFNSITFVWFLPLVVILYYLIPSRYRWILLLAGSYYFYMCWRADYIVLILSSTLIDYFAGRKMGMIEEKKKRRPWLILSLITNLGLLFSFKYYGFFTESMTRIFHEFNVLYEFKTFNVLLPVGISFYTFQTLSYSIDVYLGKQKAEKHLGIFALYVSFFPQLVAGPIERFSRLAPQFREKHVLTYDNIVNGLRLILYGLFVKMVIADNVSVYVDQIYNNPLEYSSFSVATGLFLYSFQIYCDFFGYSTIAIGSALMLGIKIMDNFKTPYLAKSISEFWQRWHISLSTWFRDYVYIPLGGSRVKLPRWTLNIFIVFVISGVWHGADWTFMIWGALYGVAYLIERLVQPVFKIEAGKKRKLPGHIFFSLIIFFTTTIFWIFFRSDGLSKMTMVKDALLNNTQLQDNFNVAPFVLVFLGLFIISDIWLYNDRFDKKTARMKPVFRWALYSILIFSIIVFSGVENFPFIYFQF